MNARARTAIGLAAVFAGNFSAIAAAMWFSHNGLPFRNWIGPAAGGLFLGGVMTLAIWLTFGDGKWYWRLVTCFVAVLAMAFGTTWLDQWYANRASFNEREAWSYMLTMLCILLIGFTVMWPWRRLRALKLAWRQEVTSGLQTNQFQSRDLLFWMFAIAGVLAAMRALAAIVPFGADWGKQLATLAAIIVLPLAAMHTAFARSRTARHWIALLTLILLIGGSFVGFDYFQRLTTPPISPSQLRVKPVLADSFPDAIPYLALTSLVLLNFLALRALGCRLIRQSDEAHAGPAGLPPAQ